MYTNSVWCKNWLYTYGWEYMTVWVGWWVCVFVCVGGGGWMKMDMTRSMVKACIHLILWENRPFYHANRTYSNNDSNFQYNCSPYYLYTFSLCVLFFPLSLLFSFFSSSFVSLLFFVNFRKHWPQTDRLFVLHRPDKRI